MKYSIWMIFERLDGRKYTKRQVFNYKTVQEAEEKGKQLIKYHNAGTDKKTCYGFQIIAETYNHYMTLVKTVKEAQ